MQLMVDYLKFYNIREKITNPELTTSKIEKILTRLRKTL